MGGGECLFAIAIRTLKHYRLGADAAGEFAGGMICRKQRRQFVHLDHDQLRCVLGQIRIFSEHHRHRLADIANTLLRQYRLTVGLQCFGGGIAKIDRRHIANIVRRPHGDNAGREPCLAYVNRDDTRMRISRTNKPHVKLFREGKIGNELAAAGYERSILQSLHRAADYAARARHCPASRTARTARMMLW